MPRPEQPGLERGWKRLTRWDKLALGAVLLFVLVKAGEAAGIALPAAGFLSFTIYFFLTIYAVTRVTGIVRRSLWSLRNRLVMAYALIAVVPVLLLLLMAGFSIFLLYQQVSAQLLFAEVDHKLRVVEAAAELLAASPAASSGERAAGAPVRISGLEVNQLDGREILRRASGDSRTRFTGLVQREDAVWLAAVVPRGGAASNAVLCVSLPLTSELLDEMVPDLGPVQFNITRPPRSDDPPGNIRSLGDVQFVLLRQIAARERNLSGARNFLDVQVTGTSRMDAVSLDSAEDSAKSPAAGASTVFFTLQSRPSLLNRRLLASSGAIADVFVRGLILIGIVFLALELVALVIGVRLTRTITHSVAELYFATERLREGDLTYRVRVQQQDQLGALGESFNAMTHSIRTLIEEQRQRQRLENELSIAREVQSQLFPQQLPQVPGLELAAVCRAAHMVSGDYYDFIPLGPDRLAIAVADISGKGISAALLMASLQAALRSQVLFDPDAACRPAELVARLNRHLYLNTSDDRYATLFYAVYDFTRRELHYTNAGHLPPLYVCGHSVVKLHEGGMVVGLFDDCAYEQQTLHWEPAAKGGLLVAFSDGLTEPENVFGEQFGARRLAEEIQRHQGVSAPRLAELLLRAVDEWAGSPEQSDDMTVIVAKLAA
jgi:sigma-B regulation protein RsbU (phosphoserine phosphatase)